jgi:hypothetical protein
MAITKRGKNARRKQSERKTADMAGREVFGPAVPYCLKLGSRPEQKICFQVTAVGSFNGAIGVDLTGVVCGTHLALSLMKDR